MEKKWNINLDELEVDKELAGKLDRKWKDALWQMENRTHGHVFYSRVAHGLSLFEKDRKDSFSEGTTQAIRRKIRSQTIQRVPDGEIITQYDKNSIEQAEIEYIFKKKVLTSEYDGKDMLKNLWKAFDYSYDYGYACVRTGFEEDLDGDPRISWTLIQWNDVMPSPDCKFIEEADWYIIREWIPQSTLKSLIDWDTDTVKDSTYDENVVKYLVENEVMDGVELDSVPLQDRKQGYAPSHSVEVRTYYCRGADEFITYVPSVNCVLRRVKNYDPRKDVPIHFLILEPDPEFPLGCSSVMWTLAQQQFADAFQSTAYQTLLLSLHPPLMVFGNLTNPKIKMSPNAVWPMGTNPNNRIEPYRTETTTLTQYGSILENVSGKMMQSMNITDSTVASDSNVARYSATPQGVEQQHLDKTITINQFQKRMEVFFQEWANHALRSYISSMGGKMELTVDEHTRRRIWDIEESQMDPMDPEATIDSVVKGDKIEIDFDALSSDLLSFEVRSGSLIENEKETERRNIQEMLIPVSQMIGNISDENRGAFENIIMKLVARLCELSDIDISQSTANQLNDQLMQQAMKATMDMVMGQQGQIAQLQQAMGMQPTMPGMPAMPPQQPQAPGAPMPPEAMGQPLPGGPMPPEGALPPEAAAPPMGMPPGAAEMPPEAMVAPEQGMEAPMV